MAKGSGLKVDPYATLSLVSYVLCRLAPDS